MTIKRLVILQIVLISSLATVLVLPKVAHSTPQGIELQLPEYVGKWYGVDQKISEIELNMLAKDTTFARKLYTDGSGNQIFASVVLSGQDLDNSIHRPERCLPAQGWSVADSRVLSIPIPSTPSDRLKVTRLHNVRQFVAQDGRTVPVFSIDYYWFVGWNVVTPSHLERTYIDIKDRILHGYNQKWAYITVASTVTKGLQSFGADEEETDANVRGFIQQLFPLIQNAPNGVAANAASPESQP